jgi:V-type H+-transporting ATPase subunit G
MLTKMQQTSGNKKSEDDANKDAEEKVKEIQAAGKKSGDKVVNDLIKAVTTPRPEVPEKIQAER